MVYVEAEAQMSTYQDAEGKNRTALNAIQRKYILSIVIAVLKVQANAFHRENRSPPIQETPRCERINYP